jgi:predicted metal-dependent peptidase
MTDPEDMRAWLKSPPKGGGGTSFIPVFEWIREQGIEPDALVYLTDGMGSFPRHAPSYPVIWGNIYPEAKYPFGDVVDVPKQA